MYFISFLWHSLLLALCGGRIKVQVSLQGKKITSRQFQSKGRNEKRKWKVCLEQVIESENRMKQWAAPVRQAVASSTGWGIKEEDITNMKFLLSSLSIQNLLITSKIMVGAWVMFCEYKPFEGNIRRLHTDTWGNVLGC